MITVVTAVIERGDRRILIGQRRRGDSSPLKWEFPGGKLEPGETPETSLIRELKEELGIDVKSSCLAPATFASHAYDDFHLIMYLFLCLRWEGIPHGAEGQALLWKRPAEMRDLPMPPADRPLVAMLMDML